MNTEILAILPSPDDPVGAPTEEEIEKCKFGEEFPLPCDYLEFLKVFGAGIVGLDEMSYQEAQSNVVLNFWSPFHPCPQENMFFKGIDILKTWCFLEMLNIRDGSPPGSPFPHKLAFEQGGLLPIGSFGDDDLFYQMKGEPSNWPLVVVSSFYSFELFEQNFLEFLKQCLMGDDSHLIRAGYLSEIPERYFWSPAIPDQLEGMDWYSRLNE